MVKLWAGPQMALLFFVCNTSIHNLQSVYLQTKGYKVVAVSNF
jgi:hypothetical protein